MRATLLAGVREALGQAGYCLSVDTAIRPLAFDLVARRDSQLLIVKVLANVDSLNEGAANELRTIAQYLDAVPIVIGERSSSRTLEAGAVYLRYGVRILSFVTLDEYLHEGVEPLVYAAPGGFYVNLDGERLRALRDARGLSLGDLAQAAGVSRRAIGMYEEGMGAMVEVAQRLEAYLDEALVLPYPAFVPERAAAAPPEPELSALASAFEAAVLRSLQELGFRVAPTARSPFSAITRETYAPPEARTIASDEAPAPSARSVITRERSDAASENALDGSANPSAPMQALGRPRVVTERVVTAAGGASEEQGVRRDYVKERVVLTGFAADHPDAAKRAAATANLAEVTETLGVFFVERRTTRVALEGTPVVSREELRRVDDPEAFLALLRERKGKPR